MSTTQKAVYTLDVKLTDSAGETKIFKIDNPLNASELSMTAVRAAWANVIDPTQNQSGKYLLYNGKINPFVEVTTAQRKVVVTTIEDLPE